MIDLSELIEAQLRTGHRQLRFVPELEVAFQRHHSKHASTQKLTMLIVGAVLVAAMPFIDGWLLDPPPEFVEHARRIQFGFMLPSMLLAAAFAADQRLRPYSDAMGLVALLVVISGWSYQRYLGIQYGYDVPAILIGVILAAVFALAGLMFWAVAPVGVLGLIIYAAVEIGANRAAEVNWYDMLGLFMLALVTGLAGYLREFSERSNWLRNKLLEQLSLKDSLTGLLNHRAFRQLFRQTVQLARRERRPLWVAAIDVDGFKPFNDTYGHPAGDRLLVRISQVLMEHSQRAVDLVGRVGGDEFALIWYDVDDGAGAGMLESLRHSIECLASKDRQTDDGLNRAPVTISLGVAWLPPTDDVDPDAAFAKADAALYEAKRSGRNRICRAY